VAAEALASSSDRHKFLVAMSNYSWEIGMPNTYFADPSGIDSHNVASARDLFALSRYLYKYRPDILAITRTAHLYYATTTEHGSHEITNIHPFVNDPRFLGGKTGRTPQAGDTMMTILKVKNQSVAFIVLGSRYDGRAEDTRRLGIMLEKII
jgi:D-alanyl-D-alanine endopeptidase (penicillin-binding protein 7)